MQSLKSNMTATKLMPFVVVGLASLFYLYEFFLRVAPGTITHELMRDFHVSAGALGVMTAGFFYGYAPMQIPAGLLGDRFGPRIILTLAIMLCAGATWLFATTQHLPFAGFARFLIGVSASFAYIGPLMLAARWFHAKRFAMITGTIQLMGSLGAIISGRPVAILAEQYGWRTTMLYAASLGIILSVIVWLVIRNHPPGDTSDLHAMHDPELHEPQRLRKVCSNPQTWWVGLLGFCFWAPMSIFPELWGPGFFMQVRGIDSAAATTITMWIWIGVVCGSPFTGWLTNHLHRRKLPILLFFSGSLLSGLGMIYATPHNLILLKLLCFAFGLSCAAQCITFGFVSDNNPVSVAGTAIGFNNMAVITGGFLLQPLVGLILNHLWQGTRLNGAPVFSVANYHIAFALMPLCAVVGILICHFKVKETYCQPQFSSPDE